jgi:hypothetical protein
LQAASINVSVAYGINVFIVIPGLNTLISEHPTSDCPDAPKCHRMSCRKQAKPQANKKTPPHERRG